jgi:hypothetical protein
LPELKKTSVHIGAETVSKHQQQWNQKERAKQKHWREI